MTVKWIKISTQMFDDEKIKLIEQLPEADTILIIWIKLLSQAGKTNASGYIFLNESIPFTDEMLSTIFNRPLSVVRLALQTLQQFGMIDVTDDNFISITNWEKHQNVDGLEKIREQTRKRVAKHRETKLLHAPATSNVTVTQSNATEEEIELEVDKEKENTSPAEAFSEWWNLYNKKIDRKKCEAKYKLLLKKNTHESIMDGTKNYLDYLKDLSTAGKFVPNQKSPLTFLNGENFKDEYEGLGGTNDGVNRGRTQKPAQYADGLNF